jgi:hypothetical protein
MSESSRDKIIRWRNKPIDFVREVFEVEPDEWQADALTHFGNLDHTKLRLSLQACAGPGKSAVLAWCGWNFLICYGAAGEHPKGACVSITEQNLRDNLWTEFSKWQQRAKIPLLQEKFTWTAKKIFCNDHPETWFLTARSFPKSADNETIGKTLSGIHSKFVLFLIDESGDIPPQVGKAAEQALSGHNVIGRILQAGNPISHDGMLYEASQSPNWEVIRITGDPEDPKRSPRIDIEWAKEQIDKYGRDDPWVMAYILGRFPKTSLNSLLGPDEVRDAMARHYREEEFGHAQKRLGIDVARFGDDRTVIIPRQGLMAYQAVIMRGARNTEIASRVAMAKNKWGSDVEFIDGTGGWGAGTIDIMHQAGHSPVEVNFSSKADDAKFYNKRAEMWFRMAEWVKKGGALPKDEDLVRELVARTYSFQNGKFQLERKDQIKDRLGFSPDKADALALTFAWAELPRLNKYEMGKMELEAHKPKTDWNPLDPKRL